MGSGFRASIRIYSEHAAASAPVSGYRSRTKKAENPIGVLGLCSSQTGRDTLRTRQQEQRRQQVLALALVQAAPWLVQRWPLVEPT